MIAWVIGASVKLLSIISCVASFGWKKEKDKLIKQVLVRAPMKTGKPGK